jgi:hypothetical protein
VKNKRLKMFIRRTKGIKSSLPTMVFPKSFLDLIKRAYHQASLEKDETLYLVFLYAYSFFSF